MWQGLERPSDAACAPYFRKNLGAAECFTEGERKLTLTLTLTLPLTLTLTRSPRRAG